MKDTTLLDVKDYIENINSMSELIGIIKKTEKVRLKLQKEVHIDLKANRNKDKVRHGQPREQAEEMFGADVILNLIKQGYIYEKDKRIYRV